MKILLNTEKVKSRINVYHHRHPPQKQDASTEFTNQSNRSQSFIFYYY